MLVATLGMLLTATGVATLPVVAAGAADRAWSNDGGAWSGQRALQVAEGEAKPVRLLTHQGKKWALLARQTSAPGAIPDTWRLREHTGTSRTGFDWRNPRRAPAEVTFFQSIQNRWGQTAAAWIHDGGLWAGTKVTRSRTPMAVSRLADEVAGAAPPLVLMPTHGDGFIIEYAGTRHEYNPGELNSCNGCDYPYPRWYHNPAPSVPDGAPADYTRIMRGTGWSMGFWSGDTRNPDDEALRFAERVPTPHGPVWGPSQVIAEGHRFVDFVHTASGFRLITLGPDDKVNTFTYTESPTYGTPGTFSDRHIISNPTAAESTQVLVDQNGHFTIAWRDAEPDGGFFVWQEDRPGSRYLEQPTLVPGTRHTETATVVTAPYGTLTVVFQPDRHRRLVQFPRAVHLPAGTSRWIDPVLLESPKPAPSRGAFSVGQPRRNGDVSVAANDDAGVWVHTFNAPKPRASVIAPTKTIQKDRTYTLRWKTLWANAADYEVRARTSKKSGWESVAVPAGARSKTVTRPRGESRCYQVRALLPSSGERTAWSSSRCITVRR
jgi:hypothetical protein